MSDIQSEIQKTDKQLGKLQAELQTCEPSKAVDLAQRIGVLKVTRDALVARLDHDQRAARVKDANSLADDLTQARKRFDTANVRDGAATAAKIAARDTLADAEHQYKRFHDADHLESYITAFCTFARAEFKQWVITAESQAALKAVNEAESRLQHARAAIA